MNRAVHDEICQDNFCTLSTDLVEKQKVRKTEAEFKIKIFSQTKKYDKKNYFWQKGTNGEKDTKCIYLL